MSELRSQKYWRNRPKEERLNNTLIPKRFRADTLDTFKTPSVDAQAISVLKKWVDNVEEHVLNGQGLYICGGTGSGKTHLAQAILKRVVATHNLSGVFITAEKYIDVVDLQFRFKDEIPEGYEDPNLLRYLQEVHDIVVIDSLGLERSTDFAKGKITSLLESRYHHKLTTIVTSLLKPQQLETEYSPSIAGIVKDCCFVIPLKAPDYRISKWLDNNAGE